DIRRAHFLPEGQRRGIVVILAERGSICCERRPPISFRIGIDLRGGAARGVMASGSKDPSGLQGAQMRKATLDKVIAELNTPHQANYATTPVQEVLSIITMATSQLDQASTKELKEEWSTLLTLARRQLKLHLEGKVYERMVGVVEPGQDVGLRAWAGRPYWAVAR
ncbi:MAG TPA: hypothetical protein PKW90_11615, partial [Myxococcota bacterium]|nr:hypothetical protein [Myxococcota bacterium]